MHCPDDWYQTFFTGVALDMWRRRHARANPLEADSILRHLQGRPPALLDVPCGNGGWRSKAAARDYQVCGVDIAPESVRGGQTQADARGIAVDLQHGDMGTPAELGTFDGASAGETASVTSKTPTWRSSSPPPAAQTRAAGWSGVRHAGRNAVAQP
ncbi:MAG: class I SAM-dependent methyltransferase [Gemmataceae bacterium]